MPGRPKLDSRVKDARGNAGKRKYAPTPQAKPGIPDPPQSVTCRPLALAEWKRTAAELLRMRVITILDMLPMRDLTVCFAESERILILMAAPKLDTDTYKELAVRAHNFILDGQRAAAVLGLSPKARAGLFALPGSEDPSEVKAAEFGLD